MFELFTIATGTVANFALYTLLSTINVLVGAYNANPSIIPFETMQGTYSNVQMVVAHDDIVTVPRPETFPIDYIRPVDPRGVVVPTTTVETGSQRIFIDAGSPYSVFDAPKY